MTLKYNTKQRYKTIQGLRSFKDTLPTEAKRILNKKGKIFNELLDHWKYIVGEELFKVCYPKVFKSSNKVKVSCLYIMVKRGSEIELEYSKKIIINKINIFFGYEVVKNIKLNSFSEKIKSRIEKSPINATKNKHIKELKNIKNKKIKDSLIELTKLFKER